MRKKPFHQHWRSPSGSISVVIPVLNESQTIASVVEFALRSPWTAEVIVVDDGSIDGTPELAQAAGARVITSTMLGKGASMEDGMRAAQHDVVVYLDGDLQGLHEDLIERMTAPILLGEADFVKARFSRMAGRVTVLTAKPLLQTYFPELSHFEQPLSGIIAARRSLLEQLRFENDYGVDIGLFIDAHLSRARLVEVDIGYLSHESQPLEMLGDMATQVARALLERAGRCGRLRYSFVREARELERHKRANLPTLLSRLPKAERLAFFDMDGVLVNSRFIVELARREGKEEELRAYLDRFDLSPGQRANRIARIFAGVKKESFEETARQLPLMPGAVETVIGLRKLGYRVGIVTDSFQIAAEMTRRRVFADFAFGHMMRFRRGKATGKITLCPAMFHDRGCEEHDHCKVNVLHHLMERLNILPESILAVGDGENDVCMLRLAGTSVAFNPKTERVRDAALQLVEENLTGVLSLAQPAPVDLSWQQTSA